jgi:hypothetical protein
MDYERLAAVFLAALGLAVLLAGLLHRETRARWAVATRVRE